MTEDDDLARRIARLEAHAEIAQLPARYARAYAALDADGLADLYDDDVLATPTTRGRAAIARRLAEAGRGPDGLRTTILHPGGHVIDLDPEDAALASGHVHSRAEVERGDGTWYHQAIHYVDRYVRQDGRWRFLGMRDHELFYGVAQNQRPNDLPPARWPERSTGRGTVPDRWTTWQAWHRRSTDPTTPTSEET